MWFFCPSCQAKYNMTKDNISSDDDRIKCKCGTVFSTQDWKKTPITTLSNYLTDIAEKSVKSMGWIYISLGLLLLLRLLFSSLDDNVFPIVPIAVFIIGIYFIWEKDKIIAYVIKNRQENKRKIQDVCKFIERKFDAGKRWTYISMGFFILLLLLFFGPELTGAVFIILVGICIIWKKDKIIIQIQNRHNRQKALLRCQVVDHFIENKLDAGKQWVEQHERQAKQRSKLLQDLNAKTIGKSISVVAIGGNGWELLTNRKLIVGLSIKGLCLCDLDALKSYEIPAESITDINVGGPGTVISGGGVMGGGFGLDGFLIGAAAATVLNILTTHKTTKTLVHVKCENSEIFLLISTMEPDETRIYLSPLFVALKSKSNAFEATSEASSVADEIEKLAKLLADGHISNEEYARLKSKLF